MSFEMQTGQQATALAPPPRAAHQVLDGGRI
jgi:hypothetical protein